MLEFKDSKSMQRFRKLKANNAERIISVLAKKYGISYVNLTNVSINTDALRLISEETARATKIAGFEIKGRKIYLAVISPFPEEIQMEIEKLKAKKYEVVLFMASEKSLEKAWSRYGDISYAVKTEKGVIDISSIEIEDVLNDLKNIDSAKKIIDQALASTKSYRISKVIELILYSADALGASDIHIEPEEKNCRLRFRVDGILTNITFLDLQTYNRILSRIKITSGMKLNIKQSAQDGRFSIKMKESKLEIRVSSVPNPYGESIVLRLLDPDSISVSIEHLGMFSYFREIMQEQIKRPNGMILNTGPTGSGKSTTLFAFLKKIQNPSIKIMTIENPVEYHVPGIVQTQVNREKGYGFSEGLRAALRQDPDVVMIGEIRDKETANVSANAALTGHLVLSTLHTNSAAASFSRILDLGVNPKILSTAVNLIIAQRLVRRLCTHCKRETSFIEIDGKTREILEKVYDGIGDIEKKTGEKILKEKIFEPAGCEKCNNTGYRGRVGVFEAILMDNKLEEILKTSPTEKEIKEGTKHQNILFLKEDAVLKVLNGTTSTEEIFRVIDFY